MSKKIFFIHLRTARGQSGFIRNAKGVEVSNLGGKTIAYRETDDGKIEYAVAQCHSEENFRKSEGRTKSQGRLNSRNWRQTTAGTYTEQQFRSFVYANGVAPL